MGGLVPKDKLPPELQEESFGDKLLGYGKAALSGINKGIASPFRAYEEANRSLRKTLGVPDYGIPETQFNEQRNVGAEREHPIVASLGAGAGTLPYTMGMPAGIGGATTGALLSEAPTLPGRLLDTGIGYATGEAARLLPKAMGKAESALEKMSARQMTKATHAQPGEMATLRDAVGSEFGDIAVDAGRNARSMVTPSGKPVFGPHDSAETLSRLGEVINENKPVADSIAAQTDLKAGDKGAIDFHSIVNRIKNETEGMQGGPDEAFSGGRYARQAARIWNDFKRSVQKYRPTSTNVEFQQAQGELGLPGEKIQPGAEVTEATPVPHSQDVMWQQSLPLTPERQGVLQPGPEVVSGEPYTELGQDALKARRLKVGEQPAPIRDEYAGVGEAKAASQENLGSQVKPKRAIPAGERPGPKVLGQTLADQGELPLPSQNPVTPVPGEMNYSQPPPLAQALARQRELSLGNRMPPNPPPEATGTNVLPPKMTIQEALKFRRFLDDEVYLSGSKTNPNKPEEAIRKDPLLQMKRRLAGIFRDEIDKAIAANNPEQYWHFVDSNRESSNALTWKNIVENAANRESTGSSKAGMSAKDIMAIVFGGAGGAGGYASAGPLGSAIGTAIGGMAGNRLGALEEQYGNAILSRAASAASGRAGALAGAEPRVLPRVLGGALVNARGKSSHNSKIVARAQR